jgi:hypothetical protein
MGGMKDFKARGRYSWEVVPEGDEEIVVADAVIQTKRMETERMNPRMPKGFR